VFNMRERQKRKYDPDRFRRHYGRDRFRRRYDPHELDGYYDPRAYYDPDPFPFLPLIILAALAVGGTYGGIWLVKEIKEPPDWLIDPKKFLTTPIGMLLIGMLILCLLIGLGYVLPKIKEFKK